MDLLFKRYASPFLLLDVTIENGRFMAFLNELIATVNEEKIYDLWMHRVFNKGYEEFKKSVMKRSSVRAKPTTTNKEDIQKIVKNSFETLNNFNPKKAG